MHPNASCCHNVQPDYFFPLPEDKKYSRAKWRRLRGLVGRNICALRQRRRMTLRKLERETGIPLFLLDQFEMGKNEIGLMELLRIACALDVEVGVLLG